MSCALSYMPVNKLIHVRDTFITSALKLFLPSLMARLHQFIAFQSLKGRWHSKGILKVNYQSTLEMIDSQI